MNTHKKTKILTIFLGALTILLGVQFGIFGNTSSKINSSLNAVLNKTSSGLSQVIQIENIKELQVMLPGPLQKSPLKNSSQHEEVSPTSITQKEILEATNLGRNTNGGLSALSLNSKLNVSAQMKLDDMFVMGYFEHTSPRGVVLGDLIQEENYEYIVIGENLALGNFSSGSEIVDEWMKSPGHRANILNSQFTEIGIAVKRNVYQGRNVWIAVQHFGAPLSLCDKVDSELKTTIVQEEKKIDQKAGEMDTLKNEIDSMSKLSPDYNKRVDEYNKLAEEYNILLQSLKKEISTYNLQVKKFNDCTQGV